MPQVQMLLQFVVHGGSAAAAASRAAVSAAAAAAAAASRVELAVSVPSMCQSTASSVSMHRNVTA